MESNWLSKALLGIFLSSAFLFSFQNCGPAKLTSQGSSSSPTFASQIGATVDLSALTNANSEPSSNVLYPSASSGTTYNYATGTPIFQNVVLLNNDFSFIEWVYAPTATVVAVGDTFDSFGPNFSTANQGL